MQHAPIQRRLSVINNQLFATDNTFALEEILFKPRFDIAECNTELESDCGSLYDSGFGEGDFIKEFDARISVHDFGFYYTYQISQEVDILKGNGTEIHDDKPVQETPISIGTKYREKIDAADEIINHYTKDVIQMPEMMYEKESSPRKGLDDNRSLMEMNCVIPLPRMTMTIKFTPSSDYKQEVAVKPIFGSYFSCLA
jgi:hypothetical protein